MIQFIVFQQKYVLLLVLATSQIILISMYWNINIMIGRHKMTLNIWYSLVGKSRSVKEIFQNIPSYSNMACLSFPQLPHTHVYVFFMTTDKCTRKYRLQCGCYHCVCMSILFCRTCYLQRNCMEYNYNNKCNFCLNL